MASPLTHTLRQFRRDPAFNLTIVGTLGLTVGLSTAVFSIMDAVFLRPLPYKEPSRIFSLLTTSPQGFTQPASYLEFVDWRREAAPFSNVAAYNSFASVNAETGGSAVSLHAVTASDNFFDVLGVRPVLGRTFEKGEEDPGRNFVVVLSHEVWQDLFAARPEAIGAKIKLDGQPYTVIGVMPEGFRFPISRTQAIYFPLKMLKNQREGRGNHWLPTVARLAERVSREDAQSRLNQVFAHLSDAYPETKGRKVQLIDLATFTVGDSRARGALQLLGLGIAALIALGCVNLAGLLLARGVRMQHEVAIRSALGASRSRLMARLLSENISYAIAGGAVGLLLADALLGATRVLLVSALNRGSEVRLNGTVLTAALVVSMLTTLLAGLWPAFRFSATSAATSLRSGNRVGMDRGQSRLRAGFVCVQVSLAMVLLVTSGLVFRELSRLQHGDFGFDPSSILAAEIDLSPGSYENRDVVTDFYTPMLERVTAIPGVRAAGLIQIVPIQNWGWNSSVEIVGQPPSPPGHERNAEFRIVTSGYFSAFGIRLLRGRLVNEKIDTPTSQRVVVVNQRFVERFIPAGLDPLSQSIQDGQAKVAIVGVVSNVRQSIFGPPLAETDMPISQIPHDLRNQFLAGMQLVVQTTNAPNAIIPDLRRMFGELDRTLPFRTPQTMDDVVAGALTLQRLENWAFVSFAVLSLVLALLGLYGLISHEVESSRRDIGIRIAIGASRGRIFRVIYRRVAAMLVIGVAGGIVATWSARKLIESVAPLQGAGSIAMILALTLVFALVACFAAFIPARRAATVDPIEALRCD